MPSRPGISTSSRATSGLLSRAAATTSSPRPTSATTSRSGSSDSSAASAPRTRLWSSASSTRITASPSRAAGSRRFAERRRTEQEQPSSRGSPGPRAVPPRRRPGCPAASRPGNRRAEPARRRPTARRAGGLAGGGLERNREGEAVAAARDGTGVELTAGRRGPLGQPGQPAAGRPQGPAAPVVDDLDRRRRDPDRDPGRLRVPDHVGDALADHPAEQLPPPGRHLVDRAGQVGGDAGRAEHLPRGGQLDRERHLPVAGHRRPHVGQHLPGQPLHLADLGRGPGVVPADQPAGQLRLDRGRGERVAEQVVQVPGDPHPLPLGGQPGHLLLRRPQLPGPPDQRLEPERGQRAERHRPGRPPRCRLPAQDGTSRDSSPTSSGAGHRDRQPDPERPEHRDRRPSRTRPCRAPSGPTSSRAAPATAAASSAGAAHRSHGRAPVSARATRST